MTLTDAQRLELDALIDARIDGCATESQHRELQLLLRENPAAVRHYVLATSLSASLHEYAGEAQAEAPDLPPHGKWAWRIGFGLSAAAAVVVLGLWGGWFGRSTGDAARSSGKDGDAAQLDAEDSIALLSSAVDCQWRGGANWRVGDGFLPGQMIDLAAGQAEIAFDSGARVLLEGPAVLELTSAWEASLTRGILRATAPPEAVGFKIANPEVDVVDLGTDFSVVTDDAGTSEVFVHEGEVEVQPKRQAPPSGRMPVLRKQQSRRFSSAGMSDVEDPDNKMARLGRRLAFRYQSLHARSHHWSFDPEGGAAPPFQPAKGASAMAFGAGPWGSTLLCTGAFSAKAEISDFTAENSRSAAFWVRIPDNLPLTDSVPMLSWRIARGHVLEIGWNRDPSLGVIGALQARTGAKITSGTSSLRDGKWHHAAVVLNRRQKEQDFAVKLYLDGRLEARSQIKIPKRVRESHDHPAPEEIVRLAQSMRSESPAAFQGEIDELHLADGPLTQGEIRRLMLQNRL